MSSATIADPIAAVLAEAARYVGELERPKDSNHSSRIDYWSLEAGLSIAGAVGPAWCASFVNQVGRQALGHAWPVPRTALVQAIVDWATPRGSLKKTDPVAGDLVVIYFASLHRYAHVGLVEAVDGSMVRTIEGNSNADGSREGYGVFRRRRTVSSGLAFVRWTEQLAGAKVGLGAA